MLFREKAAEKCKYPSKCFGLQVNDEMISTLNENAESLNLFSAKKHLTFDEACLHETALLSESQDTVGKEAEDVTEI